MGITILSPLSNKSISGACQHIHKILSDFREILKDFDHLTEAIYDFTSLRRRKRIRKAQQEIFKNKLRKSFMDQILSKVEKLHI
jgi:hypothetical protein